MKEKLIKEICLHGIMEDDDDSFFTGRSIINGEIVDHVGVPIEEFFCLSGTLLNEFDVKIMFFENKDLVEVVRSSLND